MTRKELNTHIEKRYSECCKRSQGLSYGSFYDGYVDCYCEQQKRIEKLEQQIEKMKCCENCKHSDTECEGHIVCNKGHFFDCLSNKIFDHTTEEKDYWEIKEND